MIVLRMFLYIMVFCISLIYFLPKNELVDFAVKNYIVKYDADVNLNLKNKILSYEASNSNIFYKNAKVLNIKNLKVDPFILYNGINGRNITLEGMAAGFFPKNIKQFSASYSIFDPKKVTFKADGDFGSLTGRLDLATLKVYIEMIPSVLMKKQYSFVLNNMKKTAKNYIYEYKL